MGHSQPALIVKEGKGYSCSLFIVFKQLGETY
jgi:hypothetical protein